MTKPHLHLAPHELEPDRLVNCDEPAFNFRGMWFGRERDFIGQVVGQAKTEMIFFALADEPERGNFVSAPKSISNATGVDEILCSANA